MSTRATYARAERNRARALAFIQRHPGAVLTDLMRHLDMTRERAAQLLLRMLTRGELTRSRDGVGRNGLPCCRYFAAADKTESAAEVLARVGGNLRGDGSAATKQPPRRPLPAARIFGGL